MQKHGYFLAYVFLGILLSPQICFGRIGETQEQLERRYGKPVYQTIDKAEMPPGGEKLLTFLKDNITIFVTLYQGRSGCEGYAFNDAESRPIPIEGPTIEKAEAILEANSNGRSWRRHPAPQVANKEMIHYWERDDATANAAVWRSKPNTLEITDAVFEEETRRAQRAAAAGASGF